MRQKPQETFMPTGDYDRKLVAGWEVRISPEVRKQRREFTTALDLLNRKLSEVAVLVPADKVTLLRRVTFWLEWRAKPNGAAEYHPSAQWLRENGYNPEKAGGIEINNAVNFVAWQRDIQPMMILHELSHAFHHRGLGYDYRPVREAFEKAVRSGLYDNVGYAGGGKRRAYGLNNEQEFFAELSEAYFGRNDFFPYTREHLRRYDPASFAVIEVAWSAPLSTKGMVTG